MNDSKQQGIVMPIILLIMMTLSVLSLSLLMRWNFDAKTFKYDENKMQALSGQVRGRDRQESFK